MTSQRAFLGIDLGGTDIKSVVLTGDGRVLERRSISTRGREGRDAVMDRLVSLVDWARDAAGGSDLGAVGVAIPGVLDIETGRVELMTNLTRDWNGFPMRDELQARIEGPVSLANDVRAATLGEHRWGAGKPYSDFICLAIGTGIGGGLVLGGELFMGSRGAAGEIGHMTVLPDGRKCNCGNHGCLETVASGPALTRAARKAIEEGDEDLAALCGSIEPAPHQIALAAQRGSETARRIFEGAGRMTGMALGSLICALNPQAVVIGGGVAKAGELLLDPIRLEIARRTTVFSPSRGGVDVLQSPLGGDAGAIGAAAWAIRGVEEIAS